MLRIPRSRVVALAIAASSLVPFLAPGSASAQSKTTAALDGRVVDESGATLPGVTVEIASPSQIGGARTATTDERGAFRFAEIAPGTYSVDAKLEGFQP